MDKINFTENPEYVKTCTNCGEVKARTEFYSCGQATKWLRGECKECRKSYSSRRYNDNREDLLKQQRKYYEENKDKCLEYGRQYHEANREKWREYNRKWNRNPETIAAKRQWERENPLVTAAQVMLRNAVQCGKIIKPSNCSQCGATPSRLHGHHPDYDKPLEVQWLCSICHSAVHRS